MSEVRRTYDPEFREGAVRIVRETHKPVAQVAEGLGIHPGTLGNWVRKDRIERVGAEYCVLPGQAAFLYSLMRPSHRADFMTRRWGALTMGDAASGGRWSRERWGRCSL